MMMGGRTKIGIGRTTRVKAVSMIAWGKDENIVHTLHFKYRNELDLIFPFMRSDVCWVTGAEQKMMHFPIISRHHICNKFRKNSKFINIFSAVRSMLSMQIKNTHMSCSYFGGSHHIPVAVQHINPLRQLIVSHQAYVTDVCTSWGRGEKGSFYILIYFHKNICWSQEMQSWIKR